MGRPRSEKGPQKDLRITLSAEAYERIKTQAKRLDLTPAGLARFVIMERVSVLEAHGAGGTQNNLLKDFMVQMTEMGREMEEKLK